MNTTNNSTQPLPSSQSEVSAMGNPTQAGRGASFWQAAWRRLKKNKGAMAGLVMIVIAILIAIFGYFLSPDPSPFANRIILEIGGEKPGYTRQFLQVKKERINKTGFLERLTSENLIMLITFLFNLIK
jgi:hypothetical protein